jgi:hypothetical protein
MKFFLKPDAKPLLDATVLVGLPSTGNIGQVS